MTKKIHSIENLKKIIKKHKANKKKIVLCHGVFDLLHIGHIRHFNEAKNLGDILIVTVTPDQYVNKGPNRPVFPLATRMESLAALKAVDYVAGNNLNSATKLIKTLKPNIYCKGKDYKNYDKDFTGEIKKEALAVKSIGGRIVNTKTELFSSSKIINETNLNLSNEQKNFVNKVKKTIQLNKNEISKIINSFENLKVLIIGETIIDEYIYCEALGKSGKEPVLVLRDLFKEKYVGGTAAIAKNLSSFCKKITLLTNIGQKNEEKRFIKKNLPKNVKTRFLNKKNSSTIIKKRFVEDINKTKVLGVYTLNDQPLDKKQEKTFNNEVLTQIKNHDVVIVSDYGHGLISDRSAELIIKKSKFVAVNTQVNASNLGFHVISKYLGADLITINETELRHELRNKTENVKVLMKKLSKKLKSIYTNVTCGAEGSHIYNAQNKKIISCPAFASKVTDKVGTGDAMLAMLAISLYRKNDIKFSMLLSALGAAYNIQHMANKSSINRTYITRSLQSYLK